VPSAEAKQMPEPILTLRDALATRLTSMGKNAVARYVPYTKISELSDGKWLVAANDDEDNQFRNVDQRNFTIDLVYQRALPPASQAYPVPLENMPFLDGCVNEVGTVKSLFREGGALRGVAIADCIQINLPKQPLYLPDHLINHLLFSAVVRVEFRYELP
jgi:hypothetical protein